MANNFIIIENSTFILIPIYQEIQNVTDSTVISGRLI